MKIKLDENMPAGLVEVLTRLGHETETTPQEKLKGQKDQDIWDVAQRAGYFLITQDLDFSDSRLFTPGTHHGLLLVRLRDPGRNALMGVVRTLFQNEDVESWKGCFVIVTEHKIRVLRPQSKSS